MGAACGATPDDVASTAFGQLRELVRYLVSALPDSPVVLVLTPRRPRHSDDKSRCLCLIADCALQFVASGECAHFHVCDLRRDLVLDAGAYCDGVHMTPEGHRTKAALLLRKLRDVD